MSILDRKLNKLLLEQIRRRDRKTIHHHPSLKLLYNSENWRDIPIRNMRGGEKN